MVLGLIVFLRHNLNGFADTGAETAVSLLIVIGYCMAGYFAVGRLSRSPVAAGAIAGAAVALLDWAVSVAAWVVRRHGEFLRGPQSDHRGVALLGPLFVGAIFGALGAIWARRNQRSTRPVELQ